MKKTVLLALTAIPMLLQAQWTQKGEDIQGVNEDDKLGRSIAINGSGSTFVVGAPYYDSDVNAEGEVTVFEYIDENWEQKGSAINGHIEGSNLGSSVDINAAGDIIAIGSPSQSAAVESGYASVYKWNGTDWEQMGDHLTGYTGLTWFGSAVSLSDDGLTLAVSADPNTDYSMVRVLKWDGTTWNQLGDDFVSTFESDYLGSSIDLSADGERLVIGAYGQDHDFEDQGMIQVFDWNGSEWIQVGENIYGTAEKDFFGKGVQMNDNGTRIIAGAISIDLYAAGIIRVYDWDGEDWIQIGSELLGSGTGNYLGWENDLTAHGDTIVSATRDGYAKLYHIVDGDWSLIDSIGRGVGSFFGWSVSMSKTGSHIAFGFQEEMYDGLSKGGAFVYSNNTILASVPDDNIQVNLYPNPTSALLNIQTSNQLQRIDICTVEGKVIQSQNVNSNQSLIDLQGFKSGYYLLMIHTVEGVEVRKVLKV